VQGVKDLAVPWSVNQDLDRGFHGSLEQSMLPRGLNTLAGDDPLVWISANSNHLMDLGSVFECVVLAAASALASQISS